MKKLTLLFAALVLSFTAHATIINGTPNPGEKGRLNWWVNGVVESTPVTQPGDTIVLADGEYEEGSIEFNKEGLVVMAAEGAKPVIKLTTEFASFKLAATTTFEGITFDGGGVAYYPITTEGENTGIFTFNNCVFKNYLYYAISNNNATTQTNINSIIVNNCTFHDGGSAIYMNDQAACANITIQNTTIYNIQGTDKYKAAIHVNANATDATLATQTLLDHLTIYNVQTSTSVGAITIENASETTISNCIIASPEQKWIDSYNVPAEATIQNCLVHNQHLDPDWTSIITNADPMFVDAANADFMLYAESPAIGMGDPRWGVKAGLQPGSGKLKAAVNAAQAGATIELGDGIYEEPSSIDFNKEGLTIKAAEGTNPVVKASSYLKHNATTTFIGITFDGQDVAEYTTYSYKTDTEKDLIFINCEFKNYTKSCVTIGDGEANVRNLLVDGCSFDGGSKTPAAIKSSGIISACDIKDSEIKGYTEYGFVANSSSAHTEELSIDNCIIHDCGYAAVYVCKASDSSEKQSCSSFELTNSTIYNVGNNTKDHGTVDIRDNANIASAQQVLIDHVTLYNFNTKDWYGGFMIYQSANATISNCIVSNPADLSGKNGYHIYGNALVTNSLYNNCYVISGAQEANNIAADPLFVDAANANFMQSANSPAVGAGTNGSNLGDPRWGVSASLKGKVINIVPGQQTLAAAVGYSVSPGDTIVLKDGTYEEPYSINFNKEGLVVMAAEGATPVIALTGEWTALNVSASTTFDGITFDGKNVAQYIIATLDSTAMTTDLTIKNCEFKNWLQWAISNQYKKNVSANSVVIDNCLFHNGTNSAVYFSENAPEGKNACQDLKITNSTFYNIGNASAYTTVYCIGGNAVDAQKVSVDFCTFYNCQAKNTDHGAVRVSCAATISNTIIVAPESQGTYRAIYAADNSNAQAINCLTFNYEKDNGGIRSAASKTDCYLNTDPLFVDAANNNFKLKGNSPAIGKATDGSNLGDPRWGVEAIEIGEGDNTAALATEGTVLVQVNRELSAGKLYTLALPFTLTDVVSIFGQGTIVYEYDKLLEQNGEVVLHFKEVNTISAGKPYLLKPAQDVNGFVVNNVTLSNSTQTLSFTVGTTTIAMEPVLSVTSDQTTDGKYWLASDTYLYNSTNALPSLRALFTISTPSGIAPRARVALGENVETGLDNNQLPNTNIQKVLENGQLIIIRDGVKYNVQGQKL